MITNADKLGFYSKRNTKQLLIELSKMLLKNSGFLFS